MDTWRRSSWPERTLRETRTRTLDDISEQAEELEGGASKDKKASVNPHRHHDHHECCMKVNEPSLPEMHRVILDGNLKSLKELIKSGADINALDSTGWPPMHTAIKMGRTDCAALLIKEGAGEFYYNKQKQEYLKRFQRCQKVGLRRTSSYWR